MAPEQCLGRIADPRSDVFSLGGTLYFLLTGAAPFHGSVARLTRMINENRLTPPRFNPTLSVPLRVQDIVRQAMAIEPNLRFADAKMLADHLTSVLESSAAESIDG